VRQPHGATRPLPVLADLVNDPSCINDLAPDEARGFLAQLATLQAPLLAKALAPQAAVVKDPAEALLLVPDAAARLGIEASYLYELIRHGRVPAVRLGPKYVRLHPTVVTEIQAKGLPHGLSQRYSRSREGRDAAAAARERNPSGIRGAVGRSREHIGTVRARRSGDSRAGGPTRKAPDT
jgi:excisionase family DNA binding protein